MRILYFILCLMGISVQSLYSLELFEPRKQSAKRKLFDQEKKDKENQTTPTKKVSESDEIPPTRPESPSTPEFLKKNRWANRGMYQIAVQNMSTKPVMVAYQGIKGPSYALLTPAGILEPGHADFPQSRLDAIVSLAQEPLTIVPSGEHFTRFSITKNAPQKILIEEYIETPHSKAYVPVGDLKIDLAKPILIQLHTRKNKHGFSYTNIDIVNN